MDFARPWTLQQGRGYLGLMRYRIDMSRSRNGYARVNLPGRSLALEANRQVGPVWLVGIADVAGDAEGAVADRAVDKRAVTVRADSAGEAVWRVARAAVRAVAEITHSPVETSTESSFKL
jgi:hypothetical protein